MKGCGEQMCKLENHIQLFRSISFSLMFRYGLLCCSLDDKNKHENYASVKGRVGQIFVDSI